MIQPIDRKHFPTLPGTYLILNTINAKIYIGSSVNIKQRINHHYYMLSSNKHKNKHLQSAWDKYGENAFVFIVLTVLNKGEDPFDDEQFLLDKFKPYNGKIGYNNSPSARNTRGSKRTIEQKLKIKEATLNRNLKDVYTKEYRLKLSKNTMGKNNPFYGKKHTKETIRKIQESRKDIKPFICIETNEIFETTGNCAKKYNLFGTNIHKCLINERKTTGGYSFKYINNS